MKGERLLVSLQLPASYHLAAKEHEVLGALEAFEFDPRARIIVLDLTRVKRFGTELIASLLTFLKRALEQPGRKLSDKIYVVSTNEGFKTFIVSCGVGDRLQWVESLSAVGRGGE